MVASAYVPPSLRWWFVVHFWVDVLFAVPLLVTPEWFLRVNGWQSVDPVTARLLAAALFGIGVQSLLGRNEGPETFRSMLNLKCIWSGFATVGLVLSIGQGAPDMTWAFLAIFIAFAGVWNHYRVRLKQFARATDQSGDQSD